MHFGELHYYMYYCPAERFLLDLACTPSPKFNLNFKSPCLNILFKIVQVICKLLTFVLLFFKICFPCLWLLCREYLSGFFDMKCYSEAIFFLLEDVIFQTGIERILQMRYI